MRTVNPRSELEWAVVIMDSGSIEFNFFESRAEAMTAAEEAEEEGVQAVYVVRAVAQSGEGRGRGR